MTNEDTAAWIDAAAAGLGLAIAPEWKPNVAMFFEVARTMARLLPFLSERTVMRVIR